MSRHGKADLVKRCGCGAAVVWKRTPTGARTPLDHPPTVMGVLSKNGEVVHMVDAYVPHWGTCPDRAAHSKSGEPPDDQTALGL